MKRTTLLATLTGAAVFLAGCSSTSGTAAPASSTSSTAAAAASGSSVAVAPASSAPSSGSAASSDSAGSSSASSTADGSVSQSSPAGSSPADSSSADSSSASSSAPTTTVGDSNSALDEASSTWFSAFCGGFAPIINVSKSASAIGAAASDPAKGQKLLVDLYKSLGKAFTDTAGVLKVLPPPTFTGGDAFATKVVTALGSAGPEFTKAGTTLAAIDVKKDPSAFTSALSGLSTSMTTALQPLQDLGSLKMTPETQAALEKLPACAALKSAGG
ncbi:hypothetical protein ABIB25_004076 [Nakamurella sp. UYEF19]|uniref:hypothetical protein n=1 Tax=Nakamurella sp. UYEF19 TaxID=1756392 RepID=UPI0033911A94